VKVRHQWHYQKCWWHYRDPKKKVGIYFPPNFPLNAGIGRGCFVIVNTEVSVAGPPISAPAPPLVPIVASFLGRHDGGRTRRPKLLGLRLVLHELQGQTSGCMICNVAVHEPRSRIVGFISDNDVATRGRQEDYVTSRRVAKIRVKSGGKCLI
jgi:hypothetical protein